MEADASHQHQQSSK